MNKQETILIVEDDVAMRASCHQVLEQAGYRILGASSPREAEPILLREEIGLVISDLRMPDGGGQEVVRLTKKISPTLPVIIITAYPTVESAIEGFKSGIVDYLLKPFTGPQLLEAVGNAIKVSHARDRAEFLGRMGSTEPLLPEMVGSSACFRTLLSEIRRIAALDGSVLISGETGVGKELVARAIHNFSSRASKPFIAMNCAGAPAAHIEAELFGADKAGAIEKANGGTLFLDYIGDLPLSTQVRIINCIEKKVCRRAGRDQTHPVDIRVIASTSKNLREAMRMGNFRDDLFYSLSTLEIRVPPLRERFEDIPQLAAVFLNHFIANSNINNVIGFSEDALNLLTSYPWHGNIRELQNVIQKAIARAKGPLIVAEDLTQNLTVDAIDKVSRESASSRHTALVEFERLYLLDALNRHEGNVTRTAQFLGIHRTTLHRLMNKYGIPYH